jgi:hypothetical protein
VEAGLPEAESAASSGTGAPTMPQQTRRETPVGRRTKT